MADQSVVAAQHRTQKRDLGSTPLDQGIGPCRFGRETQMNTNIQEREITLLKDAKLDAMVGGAQANHVVMQDIHFVKHVDNASPKPCLE
jgi:hypothetical protein